MVEAVRILLCPDSFKGCLSAQQVCAALAAGVYDAQPGADVLQAPLSDGGEGFAVSAAAVTHGALHACAVQDAYFHKKQAHFAVSPDGTTAYIETAQAAGIQGIDKNDLHTKNASTYGVGELIAAAAGLGCTQIVIGLGGSATTDGGMGALSALGVSFLDADGNRLAPIGAHMARVHAIQASPVFEACRTIRFIYACDVQNPFYGETGAAFVFAPQKGATPDEVQALDAGLRQLAGVYLTAFGRDIRKKPAMGAAGGLCGGLYAAFGGEVQSGFSILAKSCGLSAKPRSASSRRACARLQRNRERPARLFRARSRRTFPPHDSAFAMPPHCKRMAGLRRIPFRMLQSTCAKPQSRFVYEFCVKPKT